MEFEKIIAERPNKTIYKSGSNTVKVFAEDFSKADILNEALNTARVEETGLPIAKVNEVTKIDGKWAIVYDYIEGTTLAELMAQNPDKLDEYLEKFVDLQLQIQSKRAPLLNKLQDKMRRKISETGLDATTRYELDARLAGMKKHVKICHGDFNPSNIIVSPDGTLYVLDWSHATQGNGAADAARTYLLFSLEGKTELADKYLNLYCKKSDTAKQYVQQWLPIVAASQSVKGKPEEREFLLKWVNVVEYQ